MFLGKEIQNKWRNLRTCFRRELNKQKNGASGQAASKRRKYIYFDQLLFLLPTMEDRPTVSECSLTQENHSDSEDDSLTVDAVDQSSQENDQLQTSQAAEKPAIVAKREAKKKTPTYEESLLSILKEKKEEAIDEDKSFLLSLVPSFKKLNDTQKLDAKMEFLSTLKRLTQQQQGSFIQVSQGYDIQQHYGYPSFATNYNTLRQNPYPLYNNVQNYPSGSSTPNPTTSDNSRGSRTNSLDPELEFAYAHQRD